MDFNLILEHLPTFFDACLLTIELVLVSLVLGLLFSVPLSLARASKNIAFNFIPTVYIFFFRGTPLLVQLFLVYYGVSQFESVRDSIFWPWLREPYWCAILAFSLNTAAYTAEIFRGAIQAVPKGEIEAGLSLGFSQSQLYQRIILPRALGIALPAYGNEVVLMVKASALASTITVMEITGVSRTLNAQTYAPFEMFSLAAVFYISLALFSGFIFKRLEQHMNHWQAR